MIKGSEARGAGTLMDISVVLPIYNERDNLVPLFDEIAGVLTAMGKQFEIIAVDDGSNDGSRDLIRQEAASRNYLKAIFFRRNTGQSAAFDAGFQAATRRPGRHHGRRPAERSRTTSRASSPSWTKGSIWSPAGAKIAKTGWSCGGSLRWSPTPSSAR